MRTKNEDGFVPVILLVLLGVAVAAYVGWSAYGNKPKSELGTSSKPAAANYTGTVSINDCSKAGVGCFEQSIRTEDNHSYGLTGVKAAVYDGKRVNVKGVLGGEPPVQSIAVQSIHPLTEQQSMAASGLLEGVVYCTVKIDPAPCSSSIEIEFLLPEGSGSPSRGPIYMVNAGADGRYSISLSAGKYLVTPSAKEGFPMFVPPLPTNPVTIEPGRTTIFDIHYHDGTK